MCVCFEGWCIRFRCSMYRFNDGHRQVYHRSTTATFHEALRTQYRLQPARISIQIYRGFLLYCSGSLGQVAKGSQVRNLTRETFLNFSSA